MASPVHDKPMLCLDCGYDLRACTRYVCPECGRGFSPDDPATFVGPDHPFVRTARRCCWAATITPPAVFIGIAAAIWASPTVLMNIYFAWIAMHLVLAGLLAPIFSTGLLVAAYRHHAESARYVKVPWLLSIVSFGGVLLVLMALDTWI